MNPKPISKEEQTLADLIKIAGEAGRVHVTLDKRFENVDLSVVNPLCSPYICVRGEAPGSAKYDSVIFYIYWVDWDEFNKKENWPINKP